MEEIEVEVVREGDEPPPRPPQEWRRSIVPACAVVVAICALAVAWSQLRIAEASERGNCLFEVQFSTSFGGPRTQERYLDRLRACGADIPSDAGGDG